MNPDKVEEILKVKEEEVKSSVDKTHRTLRLNQSSRSQTGEQSYKIKNAIRDVFVVFSMLNVSRIS